MSTSATSAGAGTKSVTGGNIWDSQAAVFHANSSRQTIWEPDLFVCLLQTFIFTGLSSSFWSKHTQLQKQELVLTQGFCKNNQVATEMYPSLMFWLDFFFIKKYDIWHDYDYFQQSRKSCVCVCSCFMKWSSDERMGKHVEGGNQIRSSCVSS